MSRTIGALIAQTRKTLERAGVPGAARDAQLLVAMATNTPVDRILISTGDIAPEWSEQALDDLVIDRLKRKPMSHILGQRNFFRHRFEIDAQVLDPRPETEVLVEIALAGKFTRVLDLGTGSGAILISLLAARPGAKGVGTDLSTAALEVAARNAERIGVRAAAEFVHSDWFEQVEGRFDLIVSNPPYIALDEMAGLAPELAHEPRMALTDEGDGLSAYRAITAGAPAHLAPGGWLMVEIGPTQGAAVADMFRAAGLENVTIHPDLDGRDRVVSGQMPQKRD